MIRTGYGITLLPSLDIDHATALVVERQLKRGFGLERESRNRQVPRAFCALPARGGYAGCF
ncbi:hypothetical protein N8D56_01395 [Devosia sp. A8/3-2]|nr:hypothetical protein N8D56_01395 [Devosia sp. A8/3-2]